MWDLPGPEIELMSPALAGGFLTTAPPGTSKIYSLNFQVSNTVLLITATMLCIRSPELIHHKAGNVSPLTNISPFPSLSSPSNHQSTFYFYEFSFLHSTCKWEHTVFVFVCLISLIIMPSRSIHVVANGMISSLLWLSSIPLCSHYGEQYGGSLNKK